MVVRCRCKRELVTSQINTEVGVVALAICAMCDRRRCSVCGHVDVTGRSRRCPCGRPISLTADS